MQREEIKYDPTTKFVKGEVIHRIELYDDESKAFNNCNKKLSLIIKKGNSKDPRYPWYPYWSVEIEGEDGHIITWTPTKELILSFIDEFLIHEARVDLTRNRKSDTDVYKAYIEKIILNVQETLRKWDIPEIYKKQVQKNEQEN